ncbi:hypothetical protein L9F63_011677, partial [Diploptera punctata]
PTSLNSFFSRLHFNTNYKKLTGVQKNLYYFLITPSEDLKFDEQNKRNDGNTAGFRFD